MLFTRHYTSEAIPQTNKMCRMPPTLSLVVLSAAGAEQQKFAFISEVLGGSKVFPKGHRPKTDLEAHEALVRGLPGASVDYLVDHLEQLDCQRSRRRSR